jgi:alginate O-acetyltransferase complex protein AlgI
MCSLFGAPFFVFFSLTAIGGKPGAICPGIFIWESFFSRLYRRGHWICWIGVLQSVAILIAFKYWNFLTGLYYGLSSKNPWFWSGAFLPLGISFFTFEFIHYAVDRHRGSAEEGTLGEYLSFILFFPTMVAGPIKRLVEGPRRGPAANWNRPAPKLRN